MSYATRAALGFDSAFRDRVIVCAKEQALALVNDPDPAVADLADSIIESSGNAQGLVDLVVASPNFADTTDGQSVPDIEILAATQASWPVYASAIYEAPPAE